MLIGTHRLLSKDVQFKDLGLLVVDEEQRFGVAHKERLKQMRKQVDVLTMTATPIPRTLHMSLRRPARHVGDRDAAQGSPGDSDQRRAVRRSVIIQRDRAGARRAAGRSSSSTIASSRSTRCGNLLQRLVPEARIGVGHGQMGEEELENAMLDFMAHEVRRPAGTTIVENGLDIPLANTIIINRADRYGLSQLYQLRGRVGRSNAPAYAYLLIPPEEALSPIARKRLAAIRGVQRSRQRLPHRRARSRASRRRQPARRRADRAHRRGRLRYVHAAARGNGPRAEGRRSRGRHPREREPADRFPDRGPLRPRHEPAADDLPAHRRGAQRRGADSCDGTRSATATASRQPRC